MKLVDYVLGLPLLVLIVLEAILLFNGLSMTFGGVITRLP